MKCIVSALMYFLLSTPLVYAQRRQISFCGGASNDLYLLLKREHFVVQRYPTPEATVGHAPEGTGVIIVSDTYPEAGNGITKEVYEKAKSRRVRLYVEYPAYFPGLEISGEIFRAKVERGVVTGNFFGPHLPPMSLLGINDCHVLNVKADSPLIVLGKVAGFTRAEYGISDVKTYPLLFEKDGCLIAMTGLSHFQTGRYGPNAPWKDVWTAVLSWLTSVSDLRIGSWPPDVTTMYKRDQPLDGRSRRAGVARAVQWYYNARLFVDSSWKDWWPKWQDEWQAVGPAVPQSYPNGNGTLGVLEGHFSRINADGSQPYRHWERNDGQGEVAFAMASAGALLNKPAYDTVASNLIDFIFYGSALRGGVKGNKDSASFGLLGWLVNQTDLFFGDDNARCVLGIIGTSAYLHKDKWDTEIIENILANLRTASRQGFQGESLTQGEIQQKGWRYFGQRDLVNPHPHFESWMWACYLWLYDKTKYAPLLEKAETAIRLTMAAYPDHWKWTNGIEQERARMILPLAWLVRVKDTPEHRKWLDLVVTKVLENQEACGAIREELGSGTSPWGHVSSNAQYGVQEASLIYKNGDPVADMLYTNNFAFFGLNEAAEATGNKKYGLAVQKLSDFLTRIQVKSDKHPDLDGAWLRAFDYDNWEYWASNADQGWGAWCTQTGWIQNWILSTQTLLIRHDSFWNVTKGSHINRNMTATVQLMHGTE